MKKLNLQISALLLFLAIFLAGCSAAEASSIGNVADNQNNDINLDEWLGEYEYLYTTGTGVAPNGMLPKAIRYGLSIYKDGGQYYATFSMEGWMTYYVAKATVNGTANKISVIYDSFLEGNNYTLADESTSSKDRFKQGDILFKLMKTESGIGTEMGAINASNAQEIDFQPIDDSSIN